ncbi:DNA alkylation repair protein [bacterium]|nr:DNA alkylation repair protein [bacterium]
MDTIKENVDAVLDELRRSGDKTNLEGMARFGINTEKAFGNSMPSIRALAKVVGRQHALALALWDTGVHDARLLCAFCDDPALVTPEQMDSWAADFDSWDVTDQVCNNLFRKTPFAQEKILAWHTREEEFVRRSAFALLASLAVHAKDVPDSQFESWLQLIESAADDDRNFVKKAVNWALRQIGKRNLALHARAITCAEGLAARDSRPARWIARDALRELHKPEIIARLEKKSIR